MAGTKRKFEPDLDDRIPHEPRTEAASNVLEGQELIDICSFGIHDLNVQLIKRYNDFAPHVCQADARSRVGQAGRDVQERVARCQRIINQARDAIDDHEAELVREVDVFTDAYRGRRNWWLEHNLLSRSHGACSTLGLTKTDQSPRPGFPLEDIKDTLADHLSTDAGILHRYLCILIPGESIRLRHHENAPLQITKFLLLLRSLRRVRHDQRLALDAAVSYITQALRYLMENSFAFVEFHCKIAHLLGTAGLGWKRVANAPFLHATAAARSLRTAFFEQEKKDTAICYISAEQDMSHCFHTGAEPILKVLEKAAYNEVRDKVVVTIGTMVTNATGTRLPAELVEQTVEFAAVAEGLPATERELQVEQAKHDTLSFNFREPCPCIEELRRRRGPKYPS